MVCHMIRSDVLHLRPLYHHNKDPWLIKTKSERSIIMRGQRKGKCEESNYKIKKAYIPCEILSMDQELDYAFVKLKSQSTALIIHYQTLGYLRNYSLCLEIQQ